MSIPIHMFQRLDQRLAKALPNWPVSLVMLIAVCAGLALALVFEVLF